MTREEAIKELEIHETYRDFAISEEALDMAIKALEQDTVPFDFELYQAGLMEMPKEMIEVLDKIRAEIEFIPTIEWKDDGTTYILASYFKKQVLEIIDKYKAESEE